MANEIVRRLTPEEEELASKRGELAWLEVDLVDRELVLASLKAELAAFEGLYLRRVGVLYAELDEWNARLAQLLAEKTGKAEAIDEANEARTQAEESYSAAHGNAAEIQPFTPSPELKRMYREAAKRVHPDAANDETDRSRRERLMKEVNVAYAAGDEDALRHILVNLESSPGAVNGSGVGADLVRVLRQLRQVRDRITKINLDIAGVMETDLAKLKMKSDLGATEGRDVLAQMQANVQGRVNVARQLFEKRSAGGSDE